MPILSQSPQNSVSKNAISGLKEPKPFKYSNIKSNVLADINLNHEVYLDEDLVHNPLTTTDRWTTKSGYNPIIPASNDYSLAYLAANTITGDLKVTSRAYASGGDKLASKFFFHHSGVYQIFANLIVAPESAPATRMTIGSFKLHKNGSLYSTYWTMPMFTVFNVSENYYFPVMTFHIDDQIEVSNGDYIELVFNYEISAGGRNLGIGNDSITSILNINYKG